MKNKIYLSGRWVDIYLNDLIFQGVGPVLDHDYTKRLVTKKTSVEICCGSYYDALQVHKAGGKRIELNSALTLGGLTPDISTVKLVKNNLNLEVNAMVRPRSGGFNYLDEEYLVIKNQIIDLLEADVDGIVFGFLDKNQRVDYYRVKEVVELIHAYDKKAIFHRAFDVCHDPIEAIQVLVSLGVDRLLTSGQAPSAVAGVDMLRYLVRNYGDQIEIIAGCGVTAQNVKELIYQTNVPSVHSSCKEYLPDDTESLNQVSFASSEYGYQVVSFKKVVDLLREVG